MKIKKNLNRIDQFLRIGLGVVCIYLGFFDNVFIEKGILSTLIGVFGVINIVFALIGSCPVYLLAGINTTANFQDSKAALELRNKLLRTFILVTIAIVSIFGLVSYQIAKDFSIAEEVKLWEKFNLQKASSIEQLEITDGFIANESNQFILLGENYEPLFGAPEVITKFQFQSLMSNIKKTIDTQRAGVEDLNGQSVIWALTSVPNASSYLLAINKVANNDIGTSDLAKNFLLAAFLLQWFAIWGALIISSIVSKRINKQSDLILYQALHDQLTGLPNRKFLLDSIKSHFTIHQQDGRPLVLLVFDLNRFKDINSLLGQHSGDYLLTLLSSRFEESLNEGDVFARLDGDEFAILMSNNGEQELATYIEELFECLDEPFWVDDLEIHCEISLGVVIHAGEVEEPMDLIRQAEIAMYCSKDRNQDYVTYLPEMDNQSTNNLTIISELRRAISRDELLLYYQPKVDLHSGKTVSLEALIRWQHPERGLQFPDTFIPQAEQTGLIKPLTLWVVREALRQAQSWKAEGIDLPVAVNFSQKLLSHGYLVEEIEKLLKEYDIEPAHLELEITESAVMSEEGGALEMIADLDALGTPLSIDDFGTGYTSMSHMRDLPVQMIKVDKSFVLNLAENKQDETIVNSIINFAHDMGHRVVAEGIENRESWDKLQKMGCDTGQGYYMARPIPAEQVSEWLRTSDWPMEEFSLIAKKSNG